jgi:hypothetical protein
MSPKDKCVIVFSIGLPIFATRHSCHVLDGQLYLLFTFTRKFEIQRTISSSFFLGKENHYERTAGSWYLESSKQTSGLHVRTSKEPQFSGQFFH